MTISRAEVIASVERRRRWSQNEKNGLLQHRSSPEPVFPRWLAWPAFM